MRADLVIRGGTVVDGSGRPPYRADVVVAGDRIQGIGRYDGPAAEVVDARGRIVTPGFVDVHTHLDAQITWDPFGSPSILHGVTSLVVGNCGVGFAPCRPSDRDYLMFLMEGVEDIPRRALEAGLKWDWETFPQYLDALERRPLAMNVGAHLSHAPLRVFAMGERGASDAAASDAELEVMRRAVSEAMRAGALGFNTGRTTVHRTPAGDPVPGTFADRRELEAIVAGLADAGAGVFELIPRGGGGEDAGGIRAEFEWMKPLAAQCGLPFSMSLVQNLGYRDGWREAFALAEAAQRDGALIVPQVAVRCVGILIGFGISISPLSLFPGAGDLLGKPREAVCAALHDPAVRARLLASVADQGDEILGGLARLEHVFPLEDIGVRAYETSEERSLAARARRAGVHPLEVMLDLLVENDCKNFFLVPLFNTDLEAAGEMLSHPLSTVGLGDAGAHTTQTSDAGYATFALAYWVRERHLMPLERMVAKLTADLARLWGIRDRGVLRQGAFADLNVIDLERLDLRSPELRHDLPAGAPHLHQGAVGYEATVVNGVVAMRDGEPTGNFAGSVLRGGAA